MQCCEHFVVSAMKEILHRLRFRNLYKKISFNYGAKQKGIKKFGSYSQRGSLITGTASREN